MKHTGLDSQCYAVIGICRLGNGQDHPSYQTLGGHEIYIQGLCLPRDWTVGCIETPVQVLVTLLCRGGRE